MEEGYTIPAENKAKLDVEIGRINKRAAKIGVKGVGYEVVEEKQIEEVINDHGDTRVRKYLRIKPVGETVIVAGWEFMARIEHMRAGEKNLIHHVPGKEADMPAKYRDADCDCDHCKTNRYRKDTFILRNEAGEFKQVGRTCLKDFFGHNPEAAIAKAMWLTDLSGLCEDAEEDGWGGCGRIYSDKMDDYLATVALCIREYGWTSRTMARESYKLISATADEASMIMHPDRFANKDEIPEPNDTDRETAKNALNWIRNLPEEKLDNDYLINLRVLCERDYVESNHRHQGLVASLISAYSRAVERELKLARQAKSNANSKHFGTVGKREEFNLTLIFEREVESDWGGSIMYKFEDTDGNAAVWFCSGAPLDMGIGETKRVKATVKKHNGYNGQNQTQLTRVKIV